MERYEKSITMMFYIFLFEKSACIYFFISTSVELPIYTWFYWRISTTTKFIFKYARRWWQTSYNSNSLIYIVLCAYSTTLFIGLSTDCTLFFIRFVPIPLYIYIYARFDQIQHLTFSCFLLLFLSLRYNDFMLIL